jgi:hypothetical protein
MTLPMRHCAGVGELLQQRPRPHYVEGNPPGCITFLERNCAVII